MNLTKYISLFTSLLALSCTVIARKQTFDVVSFQAPTGWQQTQNEELPVIQ